MKTMPILAATALLALIAAPAVAQTMPTGSAVNAPPMYSTPPAAPAPAAAPMAPAATDSATPASATVPADTTVQTVSNGPVPDTPEMRAKYKPLSHAGRRTKPAGN